MATLKDVIVYIGEHYPHKRELRKARVSMLCYLINWEFVETKGALMTDTIWVYESRGVKPVGEYDLHWDEDDRLTLGGEYDLDEAEIEAINVVLDKAQSMYGDEITEWVYSTPPMLGAQRGDTLDLTAHSKKRKETDAKKKKEDDQPSELERLYKASLELTNNLLNQIVAGVKKMDDEMRGK